MTAWAGALATFLVLGAGPRFTVSRIPIPEGFKAYCTARMDGDPLEDLVVGAVKAGGARELAVHLRRPGELFPPEPGRRVALKAEGSIRRAEG